MLAGELASDKPKKLQSRMLHKVACLARGGLCLHLRIAATWSWVYEPPNAIHLAYSPAEAGHLIRQLQFWPGGVVPA